MRASVVVDGRALRANVRRLVDVLDGAALWAVVKANAYGHGAQGVAPIALEEGAQALCVATPREGAALRTALPEARILVMGPCPEDDMALVREARLELAVSGPPFPEGIPLHLKLDTGMGRYGARQMPDPPAGTVGLMSHLATADVDPAFAEVQIARFREVAVAHPALEAHVANSAAALRLPGSRFGAARCGIALYGLSPFGTDPAEDGLTPVLSWRSELALVKRLEPGESTGYGRRFVAERPTWIGIVPVGYADGFRRDLTGTEILVDGERRHVVGTISMDALAVALGGERPVGTPVTLIGDGILIEDHARVAGTIGYEIATGLDSSAVRATREVVG
jgi:alanine racemase